MSLTRKSPAQIHTVNVCDFSEQPAELHYYCIDVPHSPELSHAISEVAQVRFMCEKKLSAYWILQETQHRHRLWEVQTKDHSRTKDLILATGAFAVSSLSFFFSLNPQKKRNLYTAHAFSFIVLLLCSLIYIGEEKEEKKCFTFALCKQLLL